VQVDFPLSLGASMMFSPGSSRSVSFSNRPKVAVSRLIFMGPSPKICQDIVVRGNAYTISRGAGKEKKKIEIICKKSVDNGKTICYINQAVRHNGLARRARGKNLKRSEKKGLTNGSDSGRISELSERDRARER